MIPSPARRRGPGRGQPAEAVLLVRRRDDEDVPDAGEHQRRQRVVNHRLVVYMQELLTHASRDWK